MQEDKSSPQNCKKQQNNNTSNNVNSAAEKEEQFEVYKYQVSGKTPKYIDNLRGRIYKIFSKSQHQFYEHIKAIKQGDQRYGLKQYFPEYLGVYEEKDLIGMTNLKKQDSVISKDEDEQGLPNKGDRVIWIEHIAKRSTDSPQKDRNFLCLKNLTYRYQMPNILDIKLGRKKFKQSNIKFAKSTTDSHHFRINGMVVHLDNGKGYEECFVSKYFGQKITENQIEQYLALFFFDGKTINIKLLENVIQELHKMIANFKLFRGINFTSSSLFIAFDEKDHRKFSLKLIDFDKYEFDESIEQDTNILKGLENVLLFFKNIIEAGSEHEQTILKKQLRIFQEEVEIVPQNKIAKYEKDVEYPKK